MFSTIEQFKQWVPSAIAPNGETYWRAFSLSLRTPWYLLTYRLAEDGQEVIETTGVAWESTLLDLIERLGSTSVISVERVDPSENSGWTLRQVEELLSPADDERSETGPLLFTMAGEEGLYDSFQNKVATGRAGRKLMLRVSTT
jgi:hypothetical protein